MRTAKVQVFPSSKTLGGLYTALNLFQMDTLRTDERRKEGAIAALLVHYLDLQFETMDDGAKQQIKAADINWREFPRQIVTAFALLNNPDDRTAEMVRERLYNLFGQDHIPDLLDIGEGRLRELYLHAIVDLLVFITEDELIKEMLLEYFRAQDRALEQVVDRFIRSVYDSGLAAFIHNSFLKDVWGEFGSTELKVHVEMGTVSVQFMLPNGQGGGVLLTGIVGEGINLHKDTAVVTCNLQHAIALVEDVINFWPKTEAKQREVLHSSSRL